MAAVDAYAIGVAAWRLGAGRARKEDPVSAAAGVVLHKRPGDRVRAGDPLYELRADDAARIPAALAEARARCGSRRRAGRDAAGHRADRLIDRSAAVVPAARTAILPGQGDRPAMSRASRQGLSRAVPAPDPRAVREASLDELSRLGLPLPPPQFPLVWEPGDEVELRPTVGDRGPDRGAARGPGPLLRHARRRRR